MAKDLPNTREGSEPVVKKRRKEESPGAAAGKLTSSTDLNVYKRVIDYEDGEALKRDPEEDLRLYRATCDEFRTLVSEIAELKAKNQTGDHQGGGSGSVSEMLVEKRRRGALLFVNLKKLNRVEKLRTKQSRELLNRVKHQVDSHHLHLQNLLYEVLHLSKEVTKCLQFKSKDEEIELVPVEEFYREAPDSISRPEVTNVDGHQLKLARLEWELRERKELSARCLQLQSQKESVATLIRRKRAHIDNLAPILRNILTATEPVQENLGTSSSSLSGGLLSRQRRSASLLPHPLYFLYVQAEAHREAGGSFLTVSITGDEEEAARLQRTAADTTQDIRQDDSDSDRERENNEDAGGSGSSKRHHRKKSRTDRMEERKRQLLMKHPLAVNIHIAINNGSDGIQLTFWYLVNLHVVALRAKVVPTREDRDARQLLSGDHVLAGLYPDDTGFDSPNLANHYQLKQVGIEKYDSSQLGLAYRWCQRVCGLELTPVQGKVDSASLGQANLPGVVTAIRNRLAARIQLHKQVRAIAAEVDHMQDQGVVGWDWFPEGVEIPTPKVSCRLVQWQPMVSTDFLALPYAAHLVHSLSDQSDGHQSSPQSPPDESDIFYRVQLIKRPSSSSSNDKLVAQLTAAVLIKADFPKTPPIFAIRFNWNGKTLSATNSEAVRDMEREVNVYCWREQTGSGQGQQRVEPWILAAQLVRLITCFDVLCESMAPEHFPRDKVFLQPVRRRSRSFPFKYVQISGGIYTQR